MRKMLTAEVQVGLCSRGVVQTHKVLDSTPKAVTAAIQKQMKRTLCLHIIISKMLDKLLPLTGRRKDPSVRICGRRSLTAIMNLIAR